MNQQRSKVEEQPAGGGASGTYHPELDEVLQIRGRDEEAVEQRVRQEQHEVLVVGESHTVVHPGGRRGKCRESTQQQLGFKSLSLLAGALETESESLWQVHL